MRLLGGWPVGLLGVGEVVCKGNECEVGQVEYSKTRPYSRSYRRKVRNYDVRPCHS